MIPRPLPAPPLPLVHTIRAESPTSSRTATARSRSTGGAASARGKSSKMGTARSSSDRSLQRTASKFAKPEVLSAVAFTGKGKSGGGSARVERDDRIRGVNAPPVEVPLRFAAKSIAPAPAPAALAAAALAAEHKKRALARQAAKESLAEKHAKQRKAVKQRRQKEAKEKEAVRQKEAAAAAVKAKMEEDAANAEVSDADCPCMRLTPPADAWSDPCMQEARRRAAEDAVARAMMRNVLEATDAPWNRERAEAAWRRRFEQAAASAVESDPFAAWRGSEDDDDDDDDDDDGEGEEEAAAEELDEEGRAQAAQRAARVAERDEAARRVLSRESKTLMEALGLQESADDAEVDKTVRRLLRLLHPDYTINQALREGSRKQLRIDAAFKRLNGLRES